MVIRGAILKVLVVASLPLLSACFSLSQNGSYQGPSERPEEILKYYDKGESYTSLHQEVAEVHKKYTLRKIIIASHAGETKIDFYQQKVRNDDLVLVFPLLGGSNQIAAYFADYFVNKGFDAAIVHRNNDFKDPTQFHDIETVLRNNVIRDRIALDMFEREYGKKDFGSFGISRGAINVVLTAGVDSRLKYNVIALGATDLVRIMKNSNEKRIVKYREAVMKEFGISEKEFYTYLHDTIKTDPKYLSKYLDSKNTLMFLGLLDKTVPIQYGVKLRQEIGGPKTVFLLADHYVGVAFTRLAKVAAPTIAKSGFPFDYIEQESLDFYDKAFNNDEVIRRRLVPFRILQAPINFIASIFDAIF